MTDSTDVKKLSVAVCGLGDWGQKTLEAIAQCDNIDLLAAADTNIKAREQTQLSESVQFFTDPRQMIQQTRPDAVIITTPPAAAMEISRIAIKTGCDIIKAAPPARNLDEAVELANLVQSRGRRMDILQPRSHMPGYKHLIDCGDTLGRIFLARCQFLFHWGGNLDWRADKSTSGGGVLLEAGYQVLEIIVRLMGMPEEVHTITGRHGRPFVLQTDQGQQSQGIYDTDDTAVVTMRYPDGSAASLICSWVTTPTTEEICLHGQKRVGSATPEQCVLTDPDGAAGETFSGDGRPVNAIAGQLAVIAEKWTQNAPGCCADALPRGHLAAMAVIDAAYLSARTGKSENPWQLLEARGIELSTGKPLSGTCNCEDKGEH